MAGLNAFVRVGGPDPRLKRAQLTPAAPRPSTAASSAPPPGGGLSANAGLKGLAAFQAQGGAVSSGITRPAGGGPIVEAKPIESPAMQGLQAAGEPQASPDMSSLIGAQGMGAGPLRPSLGQRQPPMLAPLMGGIKY